MKLQFKKNRIDIDIFPYMVIVMDDFFGKGMKIVGRYHFKSEARDVAKEYNDAGYIVQVVKEEYHSRSAE